METKDTLIMGYLFIFKCNYIEKYKNTSSGAVLISFALKKKSQQPYNIIYHIVVEILLQVT